MAYNWTKVKKKKEKNIFREGNIAFLYFFQTRRSVHEGFNRWFTKGAEQGYSVWNQPAEVTFSRCGGGDLQLRRSKERRV